ncbi:MAG: dimethylmenaquinone methyltransferase [Rhizobiales bacterium]|nr:dimethylmenaquinone methyltransferase [Hyphomicrobiales bacterium]
MTITVNPSVPFSVPGDLLERWRRIPVAVAVDLAPQCQISPAIRPLRPPGQQPPLFGRAVTASVQPPDFGPVLLSMDLVSEGDVLVIATGGNTDAAMIGDVLGGHLHARRASGIVCDGAVRDVGPLSRMQGLSVYARAINPLGPKGAAQGALNVAVEVGGCHVAPGDLIIGDDDGLAALDARLMATLIDPAEAKLAKEAIWIEGLAAGTPVRKIFGLT